MIGYEFILAGIPLYVLVYLPLSHMINRSPEKILKQSGLINLNESFIAIESEQSVSCPPHNFNTYILSHEPLVIYIENFLSKDESEHLLRIRYLVPKH